MTTNKRAGLLLSIYATTRGFAYVFFEGPLSPIDWGVKETPGPGKNVQCLKRIEQLIEAWQPAAIVIEDSETAESRRTTRIRRLYRSIEACAARRAIKAHRFSRAQIRETFGKLGATTKDEIAEAIAKRIPAFEHRRPPIRRPWMSEDSRMGLFDATALVFAFFDRT